MKNPKQAAKAAAWLNLGSDVGGWLPVLAALLVRSSCVWAATAEHRFAHLRNVPLVVPECLVCQAKTVTMQFHGFLKNSYVPQEF